MIEQLAPLKDVLLILSLLVGIVGAIIGGVSALIISAVQKAKLEARIKNIEIHYVSEKAFHTHREEEIKDLADIKGNLQRIRGILETARRE